MIDNTSYKDYLPLFENFYEAVLIYNSEQILWVNEPLVKLMEYDSPDEFIGNNILSFIHPDNIQHGSVQIKKLYEEKERTGGVYKIRKKDGTYKTVVSRGTILPNLDDTILVSIVRSIEEDPSDAVLGVTESVVRNEIASALTVIVGYLDLLRDNDKEGSELTEWFEAIYKNVQRIEEALRYIG